MKLEDSFLGYNIFNLVCIPKQSPGIQCVHCDLSDWEDTRRKVEALGRIDLLVNNAAIAIAKPFLDFTSEDFDQYVPVQHIKNKYIIIRTVLLR